MIRILSLFLNNEVRTGGHRRLLELLEDLAFRGNHVTVILNKDINFIPLHFNAIRVHCQYRRGSGLPISGTFKQSVKRAYKLHKEELLSADVIMIHGETHLSSALYLKQKINVPILYAHRSNTVREILVSLGESSLKLSRRLRLNFELLHFKRYEKIISRHADYLVFQSPYDRDDFILRNHRASGKAFVIRGNIGLPRFKPELENANRSTELRRAVFVGTLGPRKGVRHLFRAWELLRERGITDINLDIIGPGDSIDTWREWVLERGFEGIIRVHGRLADPFPFISDADLMIIPSDFDSYPDTVLEALHAGTPVLGSITGGIPDMLKHSDLLFPVQDPKAIADVVERLYRDPDRYKKIKELCAERCSVFHFDWADEWEKALAGKGNKE